MSTKRQALGKGLNALLSDASTDITGKSTIPLFNVSEILISDIEANPFQPRETFHDESLEELVESIKTFGIIQPVTVRKIGHGKYQLISGERRTRASIRAGLSKIPAYVRLANDQEMLEMSLVENIHRENLNSIEVAISYKRLIDECNLKHEEVAQRIGKDRSTISNYLRLLKLPEEIQIALRDELISMGHARSIINVEDRILQLSILKTIIEEELSVREVEELVKRSKDEDITQKPGNENSEAKLIKPSYFAELEKNLSGIYQSKVKIRYKKTGKGEIVIPFKSEEELEKLSLLINKHID